MSKRKKELSRLYLPSEIKEIMRQEKDTKKKTMHISLSHLPRFYSELDAMKLCIDNEFGYYRIKEVINPWMGECIVKKINLSSYLLQKFIKRIFV